MSFSSTTKGELARLVEERECCRLAELAALVRVGNGLQIDEEGGLSVKLITENAAVARKIIVLLKALFSAEIEVKVRRRVRLRKNNVYLVHLPPQEGLQSMLKKLGLIDDGGVPTGSVPPLMLRRECCRRAYLRGAFLAGGSVNDPEGRYHLEIMTFSRMCALEISRLFRKFGLASRVSSRKRKYVVYLKDGEQIVGCLNVMGAHSALLDFENVRVFKEVRNRINRQVNCDTANLNKMVNAAVRQVEQIRYIADTIGLDKLTPSLYQVAALRLRYPDASLRELGEMMDPPLGKSGVNHRMRRLEEVARRLRGDTGVELTNGGMDEVDGQGLT